MRWRRPAKVGWDGLGDRVEAGMRAVGDLAGQGDHVVGRQAGDEVGERSGSRDASLGPSHFSLDIFRFLSIVSV